MRLIQALSDFIDKIVLDPISSPLPTSLAINPKLRHM